MNFPSKPKSSTKVDPEMIADKARVEYLRKFLVKKLSDPLMAKKAAAIIEEYLGSSSHREK